MLRLRSCILSSFISSPATTRGGFSLHRLLSADSVSPGPRFAVDEYLVATCGLTRAQALKASAEISHLKSPTNPDAVLAFLAGLGLSSADVAAVVAKDPRFLCTGVERTLGPIVTDLAGLGLSYSEIARLVSLAPGRFRSRTIASKLPYYMSLFGSFETLLRAMKYNTNLLTYSIERIVKPNVAILRECGIHDISKLGISMSRMLTSDSERLWATVACAERLGVPRGSAMFKIALRSVEFLGEEKIAARVDYLKRTFRWSDAEVLIAVSRSPMVLNKSKESLQQRSEFLISEVGLEPAYIARRPATISYSMEGRLRPRYYVLKFLMAHGLLDRHRDYYSAVILAEKAFMEKFLCPYKEAAPYLAEDYAAACRGEMPTNYRL